MWKRSRCSQSGCERPKQSARSTARSTRATSGPIRSSASFMPNRARAGGSCASWLRASATAGCRGNQRFQVSGCRSEESDSALSGDRGALHAGSCQSPLFELLRVWLVALNVGRARVLQSGELVRPNPMQDSSANGHRRITASTFEKALGALRRSARGAVFVEFLIAFLPVYTFFLCLIQLSLLFSVRLLTEHAAVNAARAAAVVIAEPKGRYPDPAHRLTRKTSPRYKAIRNAAVLSLSPLILNGSIADVDVVFPGDATPGGPERGFPVSFRAMSDTAVSTSNAYTTGAKR